MAEPPKELGPEWVGVTLPCNGDQVEIMWCMKPPKGFDHTTLGELLYFRCGNVQFSLKREQLALIHRLFKASEAHSVKAAVDRIQREEP